MIDHRFDLDYLSEEPPFDASGQPQARTIRGRLVVPDRGSPPFPVVVVAHGYTSFMDWGFFPALSEALAEVGIASLRFNFSGSGIGADLCTMTEPERFRRNSYLHELDDLRVLREAIQAGRWAELDSARCAILGHSRGGGIGLLHAAAAGDYRGVVTWAAIDRVLNFSPERLALWRTQGWLGVMHWTARRRLPLDLATLEAAEAHRSRLDLAAAGTRITCPVLVVMGDRDRSLDPGAGHRLAGFCGNRARYLPIPAGDHTFGAGHPFLQPGAPPTRRLLRETVDHLRSVLS